MPYMFWLGSAPAKGRGIGGILPPKLGYMIENPEVAVDEVENAREICPIRFCHSVDPIGARSVVAVKPAGKTKDGVKTGRGYRLGTREGQVKW